MALTTTFSFTREALDSPIVYIFYKHKVPLYVGFSAKGLNRPFHPGHHKHTVRDMADTIRILTFDDVDEARAAEQQLIYWFAPEYNQEADVLEWRKYIKVPVLSINSGEYTTSTSLETERMTQLYKKWVLEGGGTWAENFWLDRPELLKRAVLN